MMRIIRVAMVSLMLALLTGFAFGTPVYAQSRWVIVNGQRMSDAQVAYLQQRACSSIPDGHYWLNMQTGAWGYAGNPRVQGVLGDACGRQQHKSLSERRKLYRPGEIVSQ